MSKSLLQILGYVTLTGLIQKIKSGIPNPLPPKFMTTTREVIADAGRYTQVTGARRVSKLVTYGSAAVNRTLRDVAIKDVKLLHTFEVMQIPPLLMQQLRQYDDYNLQKMGMQEVARQTKEFVQLFQNMRIAVALNMLNNGVCYFDGNGNLLPTSSGAITTVSMNVDSNNQNQLNGLISSTWRNSNTNIPLIIQNIKLQALKSTGYPIEDCFYGINIPTYMTNNDYVLEYLARNPGMNAKWLDTAELPSGLFGVNWVPVYLSFFEDDNGTNQNIVNANAATFTPTVTDAWWEILEGSYTVPTTLNILTDAVAAMNSARLVHGMAGFSQMTINPPGVASYYLDTFMAVMKNELAVFQGVVDY